MQLKIDLQTCSRLRKILAKLAACTTFDIACVGTMLPTADETYVFKK